MTSRVMVAALAACSSIVPTRARAQDAAEPLLMVGAAGGVSLARDFWTVAPQLAAVAGQQGSYDTLGLSRRLPAALQLGVQIAYFRRALGFTFESTWLGLRSESSCELLGTEYNTSDPNRVNEQTCVSLHGARQPTSAMTLQLGIALRARYAGLVQPYVRTSVGIAFLGGNYVQTSGLVSVTGCSQCRRDLIQAERPGVTAAATMAVGFMLRHAPGYQIRIELRDQLLRLQEPAAPADPITLRAPTQWRWQHIPNLAMGMDVLLARTHARRY
ncbi:MAG TPA: hypothetical protein VNL98_00605 [Gemmatimonadales bacterium]|nr:hypothetical protein [Gemmatimonadales bacterium]